MNPEGPYILPIWNQVPTSHYRDGLSGPNSIMVVYMDPKGNFSASMAFHGLSANLTATPHYPDPREDPKSRSLNGGSYKVPLVV